MNSTSSTTIVLSGQTEKDLNTAALRLNGHPKIRMSLRLDSALTLVFFNDPLIRVADRDENKPTQSPCPEYSYGERGERS